MKRSAPLEARFAFGPIPHCPPQEGTSLRKAVTPVYPRLAAKPLRVEPSALELVDDELRSSDQLLRLGRSQDAGALQVLHLADDGLEIGIRSAGLALAQQAACLLKLLHERVFLAGIQRSRIESLHLANEVVNRSLRNHVDGERISLGAGIGTSRAAVGGGDREGERPGRDRRSGEHARGTEAKAGRERAAGYFVSIRTGPAARRDRLAVARPVGSGGQRGWRDRDLNACAVEGDGLGDARAGVQVVVRQNYGACDRASGVRNEVDGQQAACSGG